MRVFRCDRCGSPASFDSQVCDQCGTDLGYVPERLDIEALEPTGPGPATYLATGSATPSWRCLNAAWGCNWMLAAGAGDVWCRSCRLTRGRPAEDDPDAVEAWASAESSKRRLVHQLDALALPVDGRGPSTPHGLAFDLVHVPGQPAVTGHLDGVVTLDLAETDAQHRHQLRRQLGESFRTVIGHLRHEIGHYYWDLVVGDDHIDRFRELFGDERADYRLALEQHHAAIPQRWDTSRYITAYAAAHPLEDWAESFAHVLHIHDASDTARAYGLSAEAIAGRDDGEPGTSPADPIDRWSATATAVNAVAASLGAPPVYPFAPHDLVTEKLSFVGARIGALTGRDPLDGS